MVSMLNYSSAIAVEPSETHVLITNPLPGELVLSDFDQSNLRRASADMWGLNFQMGRQDKLCVNSDAEALARWESKNE